MQHLGNKYFDTILLDPQKHQEDPDGSPQHWPGHIWAACGGGVRTHHTGPVLTTRPTHTLGDKHARGAASMQQDDRGKAPLLRIRAPVQLRIKGAAGVNRIYEAALAADRWQREGSD